MSEQLPESSGEVVKPAFLVRALLIALPLGLTFMVPMSLWIYYKKKHAPAEATSKLALMLRQDLSAGDFEKYTGVFAKSIGERSLAQPENLGTAAGYVESTMGFANMGYNVQRYSFEVGDMTLDNLVAELPGQSTDADTVLVLADYDAPDPSGIAALMCVAHAVTGTQHARTIRFAAVTQADVEDGKVNGVTHLAQKLDDADVVVKKIVLLRPGLKLMPASWQGAEVVPLASELGDRAPDVLAMLQRVKSAVEAAAK